MANEINAAKDVALKPLEVFISHKAKDKVAAQAIKDMLQERCNGIAFFLSSDAKSLPGGKPWWSEIHGALDRAEWLVMLYSTPADNWDWCVYEAGYFAGRKTAAETKNLVVLHPPGIFPPSPLQAWQSVSASSLAIEEFLKSIFSPGNPRCHFNGTCSDLSALARKMSDTIARLNSQSYSPNKKLSVIVPPSQSSSGAKLTDLPAGTTVHLNDSTAALLNLEPLSAYSWADFADVTRGCNFDAKLLAEIVEKVRAHRRFVTTLPLFRAPDDQRGYRPIISEVTRRDSGEVELEIMLTLLPASVDPDSSNALERAYGLFALAKQFRQHVVEKHMARLADLDQESANPEDRLSFLDSVLRDIEDIRAQSSHQGYSTDERLYSAFDATRRPALQELMTTYRVAYEQLQRWVQTRKCGRPSVVLGPMRDVNWKFLRMSVARMRQLVYQFAPPELVQADPTLLPDRKKRRRRRPGQENGVPRAPEPVTAPAPGALQQEETKNTDMMPSSFMV